MGQCHLGLERKHLPTSVPPLRSEAGRRWLPLFHGPEQGDLASFKEQATVAQLSLDRPRNWPRASSGAGRPVEFDQARAAFDQRPGRGGGVGGGGREGGGGRPGGSSADGVGVKKNKKKTKKQINIKKAKETKKKNKKKHKSEGGRGWGGGGKREQGGWGGGGGQTKKQH